MCLLLEVTVLVWCQLPRIAAVWFNRGGSSADSQRLCSEPRSFASPPHDGFAFTPWLWPLRVDRLVWGEPLHRQPACLAKRPAQIPCISVHLRRALLLFAIVLGMAALVASLSRPVEERRDDSAQREPRDDVQSPPAQCK